MSRGAACGPPFGMSWDVESSCGPGLGFPLGCGSSLGLGCMTGQSWGIIVQAFQLGQGGDVTFCCRWLDAAEADGEFSQRSDRFANRPDWGGQARGTCPYGEGRRGGGWAGRLPPDSSRGLGMTEERGARGEGASTLTMISAIPIIGPICTPRFLLPAAPN